MIIIDFAHLCYKSVFAVLGKEAYPTKKNPEKGKISKERWEAEFKGLFIHYVFSYMKYCKKEYSNEFGDEIVIALEGGSDWRKEIYPNYKGNRTYSKEKYNIDFEAYVNPTINEIIEAIQNNLPYKCVRVFGAEGDDVIATLTKYKSQKGEKVLILSEDKDFKQLLKYENVSMFKPIHKEFLTYNPIDIDLHKQELLLHIILGDKADNIPHIKRYSEFSDNFILYLEKNGIFERDVYNYRKLDISNIMFDRFKEEFGEDEAIFKAIKFGEVSAKKFMGNSLEELKSNLLKNKIYAENFMVNKKLIDFDCIPNEISEKIIQEYLSINTEYDMVSLIKFFKKYECENHIKEIAYF